MTKNAPFPSFARVTATQVREVPVKKERLNWQQFAVNSNWNHEATYMHFTYPEGVSSLEKPVNLGRFCVCVYVGGRREGGMEGGKEGGREGRREGKRACV